MEQRAVIRQAVKRRRDAFTHRVAASQVIADRIMGLNCVRTAGMIMAYAAFRSEVDVGRVIEQVLQEGRAVALPVVDRQHRQMASYEVTVAEDLVAGAYGISEPGGDRLVSPEEIDVCIVPGLAFDRNGNRLGYGAGYYDNYLPLLRPDAVRIAAAFSLQVVEEIPPRPGDVPVDGIVTENTVIWTKARGGIPG